MNKYRCTFQGRQRGAIGIMHGCAVEVEAGSPQAALLKLYDTHEHVQHLLMEADGLQVNGKPGAWTREIIEKWERAIADVEDARPVTQCNYFTPRPYVDEYNRGSAREGFTYTRAYREVFQRSWRAQA